MPKSHRSIPRVNLTGQRFGRLTVLKFVGYKNKCSHWLCQCVCGQRCIASSGHLGRDTNSCGCFRKEVSGSRSRRHGQSKSPEYQTWCWIVQRTSNPRNKRYGDYGGRGIKMCERWRVSFENFYADMGPRPSSKHSIERKNNDGHYEPLNCVWALPDKQMANRRSNINLTLNGETLHLAEWARRVGIKRATLEYRFHAGWNDKRILTTPVKSILRQFKIELPLPPHECSPNARVHWGAKARATREYREACGYLTVKQLGRRRAQGQVVIDLDFYLARPKLPDGLCRPRDRDNAVASSKAAIDSLRDSGLITNDSKKHVRIGNVNLHSTRKEHQGRSALVLTVTENNT